MKPIILLLLLCSLLSAQSFFADGAFHIMSSSHQDIGWEDTPHACAAYRDTAVISPALELLAQNPDYCYSVEATLSLLEYLERHPDKKEKIQKYVESGRLEWGATYNQPYESMYYGEALIRQTYFGRKLLKDFFPDANPRVYWNPDVPGRAMQMPQILKKSGIDYMMISRHGEGFFQWESPDGSSVVAWSPGHYYNASRQMLDVADDHSLELKNINDIAATYKNYLAEWTPYYQQHHLPPVFGGLLSRDMFRPMNLDEFFEEWNSTVAPKNDLPPMRYSTIENFLDAVMDGKPSLKRIVGERPNIWLYIHGPTHHKALSAGREAARLLVAAEKFSTIRALIENDWATYPQNEFEQAWMDAVYPDHGWGGVNGHITDGVFRDKFESAREAGDDLLNNAVSAIAQKVKKQHDGIPLVVFNPMSWNRTEPVRCAVNVDGRAYPHLGTDLNYNVVDEHGNRLPHQVIAGAELVNELDIVFHAPDVPSMGYKTFYLVAKDSSHADDTMPIQSENSFYKIEFAPGGIQSIFDKE